MMVTVISALPLLLPCTERLSPMSGVPVPDHEHHEAEDEARHPRDHVGCPPALAENIESGQVNASNLELQDKVFKSMRMRLR